MHGIHEVVVGVEASVASERALDVALLEAQSTSRPLRALHAWAPAVGGRHHAATVLDECVMKALERRLSGSPVGLQAELVEGDPGPALVAAGERAGLVVVGRCAHPTLRQTLLGGTSTFVLRHCAAPVMVVPAEATPAIPRRVLVGVDGSPASRSALLWGWEAARRHSCPLVAVHAVDLPGRAAVELLQQLVGAPDEDPLARLRQEVQTVLPADAEVTCRLSHLSPAKGLEDLARDDDLLVVGHRGRGGMAEVLPGSVATHCAHHAAGAVVVVRADAERLPA